MGYSTLPHQPMTLRGPQVPQHMGREKEHGHGWGFTSWHSPAPSGSKAGVPKPSPGPPAQGRLIPRVRGGTLTPGQCPAGRTDTLFSA